VTIISFSGIDGAGKSTQIHELDAWLRQSGLRTQLLTFWDDVAAFSRWRELLSSKIFRGDCGIGSPEKPLNRRDKNVSSPWLVAVRVFIYLADAASASLKIRMIRKTNVDIVIFDRYLYDELANLPLHGGLAQTFVRVVLKHAPKPDVAFVIDADPVVATARKPEYPLEFVRSNRRAYLDLAELAGNMIVVGPGSIETLRTRIRDATIRELSVAVAGAPELSISPLVGE